MTLEVARDRMLEENIRRGDDLDFHAGVVVSIGEGRQHLEWLLGSGMRRFAMISPYFPPSSFVGAKRRRHFQS